MKPDIHEQAREILACGGLDNEGTSWLRQHLQECHSCQEYAEAVSQIPSALHSISFAADADLVRSTQLKVRARAEQLRQERERLRLVWLSCLLLALSGATTTHLLWKGFNWIGELTQAPGPVWQLGFAVFWIAPALVISVVLIARGIHLGGTTRGFTD